MKVFATTAMRDPGVATYLPVFQELAARDRFRVHEISDDPVSADIILFLDGHQHYLDLELRAIRQHPLTLKYREKTFVYSEVDQPWCAMPGLYVAMPRASFNQERQRACAYLTLPNSHVVGTVARGIVPDLLFSFLGRVGNRTRQRILEQRHSRAIIGDTSSLDFFGTPNEQIEDQKHYYAEVIERSKFVLCPRGAGASSFRIFETMAAGRVPVILSDAWMPPHGPEWYRCALFVKESRASGIGKILEQHEARFPEMALAARRTWEQWFAPDVIFHRMTEGLADIIRNRRSPEYVLSRKFDGRHLRLQARAMKSSLKHGICGLIDGFTARALGKSDLVSHPGA